MTTTAPIQRRSAALARRWVVRALLVVGGALAGTAAAWALAMGTASAAEQPSGDTPVTDATVHGAGDVLSGAAELADAADPASRDGARAERRAPRFVSDVEQKVLRPAQETVGAVEKALRDPRAAGAALERHLTPPRDFGDSVWRALDPTGDQLVGSLPDLPGVPGDVSPLPAPEVAPQPESVPAPHSSAPGASTVDTTRAPETAAKADIGSAPHSRGEDAPSGDSTPASPLRMPLAPLALPSHTGGSAGGLHIDGPLYGVPAVGLAAFDDAGTRSVLGLVRHLPVRPGAQPGVTPD